LNDDFHVFSFFFSLFFVLHPTCGLGFATLKAKEEVEALEKKMQQLENELAQTQTNLETATHKLEEKEKALQNVSADESFFALGLL
jgi:lipid II:glycine glycyltransferase (peptidoglycan interpeptide bridge formation enzyme)